jgi:hypothetical protein
VANQGSFQGKSNHPDQSNPPAAPAGPSNELYDQKITTGQKKRTAPDKNPPGCWSRQSTPVQVAIVSLVSAVLVALISVTIPSMIQRLFPTPTTTPTHTPTLPTLPIPTSTLQSVISATSTETPIVYVIANFPNGIGSWRPALAGKAGWSLNEAATDAKASTNVAGQQPGALYGKFDYGISTIPSPRATYFVEFPATDWTSYRELHVRAKFLPQSGTDVVKATVIVFTGSRFCFNEHGWFQVLGTQWTDLVYPLKLSRYKTCTNIAEYTAPPIDIEQVVRLGIVFIPDPDTAKFSGEILIDGVQLVK